MLKRPGSNSRKENACMHNTSKNINIHPNIQAFAEKLSHLEAAREQFKTFENEIIEEKEKSHKIALELDEKDKKLKKIEDLLREKDQVRAL
jgi:hypothetical protein